MHVRRDEVIREHLLGREHLGANVAGEAAGLEVDDVDVDLQGGPLGEAFVALIALVHFLLLVDCNRREEAMLKISSNRDADELNLIVQLLLGVRINVYFSARVNMKRIVYSNHDWGKLAS